MSSNAATHWTRAHGTLLLAVSLEPHEIGKRIAQARDRKGWTQLSFALEANVSPSSVARWESGKLPPVRELIRIAEVLGVDPVEFVEPTPTVGGDARLDQLEETMLRVLHELRAVKDLLVGGGAPPAGEAR